MTERTLILSASNVLARGFYAVPIDRVSTRGEPVNALFALVRAVRKAIAFKLPARAVAVVDPTVHAGWPPLLAAQLPRLVSLVETLGFHVVSTADELSVVASYARAALEAGDDVVVVGTDKRYAQLVGDRAWWYDANKDARYTVDMVVKRFDVPPPQVAEWLALVGNKDDGLPGIAGIGAKGAAELLAAHGSIASAIAAIDSIKGRAGNALRAAVAQIPAEIARATLARDRPLPLPLAALAFVSPPAAPVNAIYKELGFVEYLASDATDSVEVSVCDSDDAVRAALASLGPGPIALHALTEDPSPIRGALVGIALSAGDRRAFYVPAAHLAPLAPWLADARAPKLGHDTKIAVVALRRRGLELAGIAGDSQVASHLAQPSNWAPHDLPLVAKHVLGRALPDADAVRGVGQKRKTWGALTVDHAGDFAGTYAEAAAATWRVLEPGVDAQLHAEYLELADTLVRMELRGIGVDRAELDRAEEAFAPIESELEQQITALAGKSFNLGSSKQLGTVLFEELGLPVVLHTKTGWSTATEALERIEHAHPIVALVIRWRALRRMRDTWITALRACVDDDGRVRSCFHPARSFSGHLVNSNPDLGRVPGRTPEMARIRRAFVPRPGNVLMSVDYNQLGLHVLAHLTRDPALVEPLRAHADVHAQTASAVLELPVEAIGERERQIGKVVNFATFAGQGASALALQLGMPATDAKELIARFDRRYSQVRAFQDEQLALARERGYIVTIAGRHWPIGGLESLDSHDRSYAERLARRATHEGSVADVARRGLLDADRALRAAGLSAAPLVQVVDEVLFEVPEGEIAAAARIAADAMRDAFVLEAPLRVGIEVGPNWADLASYRT